VIYELERSDSTKKTRVPIEDVFAISYALGVAPLAMVVPEDDDKVVRVTENEPLRARDARAWLRGDLPMGLGDGPQGLESFYRSHTPGGGPHDDVVHEHPQAGQLRQVRQAFDVVAGALAELPPSSMYRDFATRRSSDEWEDAVANVQRAQTGLQLVLQLLEAVQRNLKRRQKELLKWGDLPVDLVGSDPTQLDVDPPDPEAWASEAKRRRK
jgi:hypothetical protein